MIKTDGKYIYISCGESCYCIPMTDGTADAAYFGRRIEPEDDLGAVYSSDAPEFFVADGSGNIIDTRFTVVGVETADKDTDGVFPMLTGGKTVKLTLEDKKRALTAELYYTPYPRGAIARRSTLINNGKKPVTVRVPGACLTVRGKYELTRCGSLGYIGLKGERDSYGMLMLYCGGTEITFEQDRGIGLAAAFVDETFTLAPGESVTTPETVLVRSEYPDGAMRAFHDIFRDNAVPERFDSKRKRAAIHSKTVDASLAEQAAELGADALILPADKITPELTALAGDCKKRGVMPGACVDINKYELSDPSDADRAYTKLTDVIDGLGAEYIAPQLDLPLPYAAACGFYALIKRLAANYPDLIIEGVGDPALLCYTPLFGRVDADDAFFGKSPLVGVLPASSLVCCVTGAGALKDEFDICSLGALRYMPTAVKNDGARLAIRAQMFSYQDDSPIALTGDIYKLRTENGDFALAAVAKDKSRAYAVYMHHGGSRVIFDGLDVHDLYRVRELDKVFSGAALTGIGLPVPDNMQKGETLSFHLRQVADYDI